MYMAGNDKKRLEQDREISIGNKMRREITTDTTREQADRMCESRGSRKWRMQGAFVSCDDRREEGRCSQL